MDIQYTRWKLLRLVRNSVDGRVIKGTGQAVIDAAFYNEYGIWINTDSGIHFEQSYKFIIHKNIIQVTFTDNRHFFAINLSSPLNTFVHHCGQDIYEGWIKLLMADIFYTCIIVKGPRKNYSIKTLYRKAEKIPSPLFF